MIFQDSISSSDIEAHSLVKQVTSEIVNYWKKRLVGKVVGAKDTGSSSNASLTD